MLLRTALCTLRLLPCCFPAPGFAKSPVFTIPSSLSCPSVTHTLTFAGQDRQAPSPSRNISLRGELCSGSGGSSQVCGSETVPSRNGHSDVVAWAGQASWVDLALPPLLFGRALVSFLLAACPGAGLSWVGPCQAPRGLQGGGEGSRPVLEHSEVRALPPSTERCQLLQPVTRFPPPNRLRTATAHILFCILMTSSHKAGFAIEI